MTTKYAFWPEWNEITNQLWEIQWEVEISTLEISTLDTLQEEIAREKGECVKWKQKCNIPRLKGCR